MTSAGVKTLRAEIEATLRPLADVNQAAPMGAYMLDQFKFLGIRATPRRDVLRELFKHLNLTAVDLLAKHHTRLQAGNLPRLLQLVQKRSWWDTVDGLAGVVSKSMRQFQSQKSLAQELMDECLTHSDPWVRRVAMLHQLGWKKETDEERLLRYALALGSETDFFIRKAIGWALRDYARTRPEVVRTFLRKNENRLSGLTRREAGKHLDLSGK